MKDQARFDFARNRTAQHLTDIQSLFQRNSKITCIVRLPGNPEADFVLTSDELPEAMAVLERRQAALLAAKEPA